MANLLQKWYSILLDFLKQVPDPAVTEQMGLHISSPLERRRRNDSTRFTQHHYDYIVETFAQYKEYNRNHPNDKRTTHDLTKVLNLRLGLKKSRTSYANIWNHKVDRNSLAYGTQLKLNI